MSHKRYLSPNNTAVIPYVTKETEQFWLKTRPKMNRKQDRFYTKLPFFSLWKTSNVNEVCWCRSTTIQAISFVVQSRKKGGQKNKTWFAFEIVKFLRFVSSPAREICAINQLPGPHHVQLWLAKKKTHRRASLSNPGNWTCRVSTSSTYSIAWGHADECLMHLAGTNS